MKRVSILSISFLLVACFAYSQQVKSGKDRNVGSACEACDEMYEGMPADLSWETTIAGTDEPGERLIISGTIYEKDGKTPAKDVILYVYHTDNSGYYSLAKGQTNGRRHGHLRGWMKTDATGRYEFHTIRPGPYPGRKDPQHIHCQIKEPGLTLYWIDSFKFLDDPRLTKQFRNNRENRGGSGIIELKKNSNGVWIGKRDIILGKNVPNY